MIEHLRQIEFDSPVTALTVSADGAWIAVGGEGRVERIAADSGELVRRIPVDTAATGVALSTDNRLLAVATGAPTVTVYDAGSGQVVHRLVRRRVPDFLREQPQVRVAFFPQRERLITQAENSDVSVWDSETGGWEFLYRMPHRKGVMAMSPTGERIAMFSEPYPDAYTGQVTMYRVEHGLRFAWNEHHESDQRVSCGAFSPSGSRLATCAADDGIRIWDVDAGSQPEHLAGPSAEQVVGIAYVGDEEHLLSVGMRKLEVHRIGKDSPIASVPAKSTILGSSTSAESKLLVTSGEKATLDLWRIDATS